MSGPSKQIEAIAKPFILYETNQMRRGQHFAAVLVSSALLGGVATALVLLFSELTGAHLPWSVASVAGALIGSVVGHLVWPGK
jgi:hypothetical protein